MDYRALQTDLLRSIRQKKTQAAISQKLGFEFNQVYRWESGRTQVDWVDFVEFCLVCKAPLQEALETGFSYFGDPRDFASLTQHFVGKQTQASLARDLGISRYTLSRWVRGRNAPNLQQMMKLMHLGSLDFYRFSETLAKMNPLPSIQAELQREKNHLALYERFPWLSTLLSALDLAGYPKDPTLRFLSQKTRVPIADLKRALEALQAQDLLHWNGRHWETRMKRLTIRGSSAMRCRLARHVLERALDGVESAVGQPSMRYAWKQFNLNQKQYELLLQKFSEFFNEMGQIIDHGQKDADKVYLFSAAFVNYDLLPLQKESPFSKKAP